MEKLSYKTYMYVIDINELEEELSSWKGIINCDINREAVEIYWNYIDETRRKNLGKSREEIENPDTCGYRSVIDFGGVSKLKFKDLSPMWKTMVLTGLSPNINMNNVQQWMDNI
jgi:hypothetical protein